MKRLQEIFSWLMCFVSEKKNCTVKIEINFQDGNVRTCKIQEGKNFKFKT